MAGFFVGFLSALSSSHDLSRSRANKPKTNCRPYSCLHICRCLIAYF